MFKILIVEDDKELSLLFQKVLEKERISGQKCVGWSTGIGGIGQRVY